MNAIVLEYISFAAYVLSAVVTAICSAYGLAQRVNTSSQPYNRVGADRTYEHVSVWNERVSNCESQIFIHKGLPVHNSDQVPHIPTPWVQEAWTRSPK